MRRIAEGMEMTENGTTHLMAPATGGEPVFRSVPWLLLAAVLRGFGGTMLLLWSTAPGIDIAGRAAIALAGVLVIALAVRTLFEGVLIEPGGVFVRNVFRSWRLRWDEIEDVEPARTWFNLAFTLRDGRQIPARGVGAVSRHERERLASVILATRPKFAR
ncbi:MAG TPA: PH domain-containing protein [Gaiellaceae bacterium]|nr:PH domain-containing protein [Gaiellaceae bacterium]